MTNLSLRELPQALAIRRAIEQHPTLPRAIDDIAASTKLPRERVRDIVSDAVIDALDRIGDTYAGEMTAVVNRMVALRQTVHQVYEGVLSGSPTEIDLAALRNTFEQLHEAATELADPQTWARRRGSAVEALPRQGPVYPGARPGLENLPTSSPRPGTEISGGRRWRERKVGAHEITLEIDTNDELYWQFPELREGEVLHFPDYGYRVWREPGTGAIVEEHVVGDSVSAVRSTTQGEEAIFRAGETSAAHEAAGTHRAHGAGSPGLGFDSPYGVVHAARRVNLSIENSGVELWVRNLRDARPPGVDYVYTTKTYKTGQNLAQRVYRIGAIADGTLHPMYEFTLRMGGGLGDQFVEFDPGETTVHPGAERFTAPRKEGGAAGRRVEPPPAIRRLLDRWSSSREVANPRVKHTLERLAGLRARVSETAMAAMQAQRTPGPVELDWAAALDEAHTTVDRLNERLGSDLADPGRIAAIDAAITAYNRRRTVDVSHLRALIRQLEALMEP